MFKPMHCRIFGTTLLALANGHAVAQSPMLIGPFDGKFDHKGLNLIYNANISIEKMSVDRVARVSARAILDLSHIEKNFREIIYSQINKESLKIGTENFNIYLDPKRISLVAIGGKPYVITEISLNNAKFLGKDVNDVFDKAIIAKVPVNFTLLSGTGATISTGLPTVTLHGTFKDIVEYIDVVPFIHLKKTIQEEVAKSINVTHKIRMSNIDPYKITMNSYKVCAIDGKFLLDAKGSAILDPAVLTPLMRRAMYPSAAPKPPVRVIIKPASLEKDR